MIVDIIDSGGGVPATIHQNLFEPFVSEGKQKGTGLGLTLAHCIAMEHGGEVVLLSSCPGETIFSIEGGKGDSELGHTASIESKRHDQVIAI